MLGATQTVLQQVPQPHITTVSPDPVVGSNYRQWLTVHGSEFAADFRVRMQTDSINAHITNPERLRFVSSEQVQVYVTLGTEAAVWCIQIINPGGATSPCFSFDVLAPAPVIDSINPIRKTEGEPGFTLTAYGVFATYSVILWNGQARPTRPLKSSEQRNAVTIGLEAHPFQGV